MAHDEARLRAVAASTGVVENKGLQHYGSTQCRARCSRSAAASRIAPRRTGRIAGGRELHLGVAIAIHPLRGPLRFTPPSGTASVLDEQQPRGNVPPPYAPAFETRGKRFRCRPPTARNADFIFNQRAMFNQR